MSDTLTNNQIKVFTKEVKHAEQTEQPVVLEGLKKAGCRKIRMNVVGKLIQFPKMGKAFLQDRGAHASDITPANVEHSNVDLVLKDKAALEYTDIFAQAEVNYDNMVEVAYVFASAIAREKNQVIIDALEAGTYNTTRTAKQGLLIDDNGTPDVMTVDKMKKASAYLNGIGANSNGRVLFLDSNSHEQLMNDPEFISNDFNNLRVLNNAGKMDEFVGFKIVLVSDDYDENGNFKHGLPLNNNIRKCYALQVNSMGYAEGSLKEDNIKIQWHNEKSSHSILATLKLGAIIVDNEPVVEIQNDITA